MALFDRMLHFACVSTSLSMKAAGSGAIYLSGMQALMSRHRTRPKDTLCRSGSAHLQSV